MSHLVRSIMLVNVCLIPIAIIMKNINIHSLHGINEKRIFVDTKACFCEVWVFNNIMTVVDAIHLDYNVQALANK